MASLKVKCHITNPNETNGETGSHALICRLLESKLHDKLDVFQSVSYKNCFLPNAARVCGT
jgi:hypothetical protein